MLWKFGAGLLKDSMTVSDKNKKILIVDDAARFGQYVLEYLSELGHEATHVRTPEEALYFLRRREFDIALIDINLPFGNGFDFTRMVMKLQPGISAILMSESITINDYFTAQINGARELLMKPFDAELLDKMISQITAKKTSNNENLQAASGNGSH